MTARHGAEFGNPVHPLTPASLGRFATCPNWAHFADGDAEFATGMGTTLVRNVRAHLRRDGLADTAANLR